MMDLDLSAILTHPYSLHYGNILLVLVIAVTRNVSSGVVINITSHVCEPIPDVLSFAYIYNQ